MCDYQLWGRKTMRKKVHENKIFKFFSLYINVFLLQSQKVVFFVEFWKERLSYQSCAHNASKLADRVAHKPMLFICLRMELTLKLFLKVMAVSMQNQKNDNGFIF